MKFFKQKNLFSSSVVIGSILGALTVISCSSEQIDEENELNSVSQSLATPESGRTYTIRNRNSNRFMDIVDGSNSDGANLQQFGTSANATNRQWEVIDTDSGFVRLRGVDSGKSLEVKDGNNANGANVEQRSYGGLTHQQWEFVSTGDGFFRIRSRDSRKSITVNNASTSDGANIEIDNWNGDNKFQWFFTEVGSSDNVVVPSTGSGDFGLDPNLEPWENFDLSDWALDTPIERPSDRCKSIRIEEDEWDEIPGSAVRPHFFTHTDGGMRFRSLVGGATTSDNCNQGFPRSELRENLRAGNKSVSERGDNANNWALGYQPSNSAHGGRNGRLTATLRVNQVTTTGNGLHPGRVIIGQIHASDDEPARLYYRKCPGAEFGSIYLEHQINGGNDVTFNMIGSERCDGGNGPEDGIRLDELFSYEIINEGPIITVNVIRGDADQPIIATAIVDMNELNSGYDERDEWMYFKAGVYTQNNTGADDDSDIATFYRLSNSHDSN